jgi:hypothetical protein
MKQNTPNKPNAANAAMGRISVDDARARLEASAPKRRGRPKKLAKTADTEQQVEREIENGKPFDAGTRMRAKIRENTRPRAYSPQNGAKQRPFVPSGRNAAFNLDRTGINPDEIIHRPQSGRKDRT